MASSLYNGLLVQAVQLLRYVQVVQIDPDKFNVLNNWNVWNKLTTRAARLVSSLS
jgi:hypothetical protein